jgi:hypothetical protein
VTRAGWYSAGWHTAALCTGKKPAGNKFSLLAAGDMPAQVVAASLRVILLASCLTVFAIGAEAPACRSPRDDARAPWLKQATRHP